MTVRRSAQLVVRRVGAHQRAGVAAEVLQAGDVVLPRHLGQHAQLVLQPPLAGRLLTGLQRVLGGRLPRLLSLPRGVPDGARAPTRSDSRAAAARTYGSHPEDSSTRTAGLSTVSTLSCKTMHTL